MPMTQGLRLLSLAFAVSRTASLAAAPIALAGSDHDHAHDHSGGHYIGHAAAPGQPDDSKAKARTIVVTMSDEMRFQPKTITVKQGETIRFVVKNVGALSHEITLGTWEELLVHRALMEEHREMQNDDPNAVTVAPGGSKTLIWTFTKTGSFDFACLIHGHMPTGMADKSADVTASGRRTTPLDMHEAVSKIAAIGAGNWMSWLRPLPDRTIKNDGRPGHLPPRRLATGSFGSCGRGRCWRPDGCPAASHI